MILTMPNLHTPLSWDEMTVKNRIVMAPMTRGRAENNLPNDMMAHYYAQRASAGLIITEGTFISPEAIGWHNAPGVWTDEQADAWKPIVDSLHQKDTPVFLQLWHTGRASHSDFLDGELPVAPSPVKHQGDPIIVPSGEKKEHETPRPLETNEIGRVVDDYRKAAARAKEAGFDGIEIHAANGYLLDQFLQSKTNQREDQYGGSLENRFRIVREILEACQSVFSSERIGIRISPNGAFNDMGSPDYRETFTYVVKELANYNLGYLHAIDGLAFGFHELGEPITLEEIRGHYEGRLMGNCGYEKDDAAEALFNGDADMIAFGRPFISNPDLVERFENNWKFNETADQKTWYSSGPEGYIDYPFYADNSGDDLEASCR